MKLISLYTILLLLIVIVPFQKAQAQSCSGSVSYDETFYYCSINSITGMGICNSQTYNSNEPCSNYFGGSSCFYTYQHTEQTCVSRMGGCTIDTFLDERTGDAGCYWSAAPQPTSTPPATCPNGTCGAGEDCGNCPSDCGSCPPAPSPTPACNYGPWEERGCGAGSCQPYDCVFDANPHLHMLIVPIFMTVYPTRRVIRGRRRI